MYLVAPTVDKGSYVARGGTVKNSDEWREAVIRDGVTTCPACDSENLTMGACAVGALTVHQEYVCEACQHEFTAVFALARCYQGHPE